MRRPDVPGYNRADPPSKVDVVKRSSKGSVVPPSSRTSRGRGRARKGAAASGAQQQQQVERKLATVLGATARSARMRAGLTQADVAERVGIATEVYGRLERGRMLPSVPTLWKLCSVLRTSSDEFMGLTSAPSAARPGEVLAPFGDESTEADERPEMRRLLRTLRKLGRTELKLMNLVAGAIHPPKR
jgi:transcriptional regulator with XRE-family HTH domain